MGSEELAAHKMDIKGPSTKAKVTGAVALAVAVLALVGSILFLRPLATTADAASSDTLAVGDTITFYIDQTVNDLGVNAFVRYSSMSISDTLPSSVTYKSAKLTLNGTDITSKAGTVSYNSSTHTVTFTFSSSYLSSGMALDGETYRLEITTTFSSVPTSHEIVNTGVVTINGTDLTSNEVTIPVPYDVTFIDGLDSSTIDEQSVYYGESASDPGAPEHEGYIFTGWDKTFNYITGDLTVTAQYEPIEITISKTAPSSATVGETVTYNVTVGIGTADATVNNLVITDVIPDGMTYVDGSASVSGSVSGTTSYASSTKTLTANVTKLSYGQTVTLTFKCTVDNVTSGTSVTNTASAIGGGVSRVTGTARTVITKANLSIAKRPSATTVAGGDTVTYTVVVKNDANAGVSANNVVITDALPDDLTYVDGSLTTSSGSGSVSGNDITVSGVTLAPGASVTVTYKAKVVGTGGDDFVVTNTAYASATNADEVSDSADVTTTWDALPETGGEGIYGIGAFALALCGAALCLMRRRSQVGE